MKANDVLVGLAAGATTALLCLGIVGGTGLSVLLYFFSAIPLMVAALGWSTAAGLAGAIFSTVLIAALANVQTAVFIVMTTILPATAAGYWMNLARPAEEVGGPAGKLVWYPLSDVIVRLSLITAAAFIFAGALIGYGPELVDMMVGEMVARVQETNPDFAFTADGRDSFMAFMTTAIPFMQPALWLMILTGSLYIALAITRTSGRLKRPKDDWPLGLRMPRRAAIIFAFAMAGTFFTGGIGLAFTALAGGLAGGFTLAGFAVFHHATRNSSWRALAMIVVYGSVALLGFPVIALMFVGLIATARYMPVSPGGTPPPAIPPSSN